MSTYINSQKSILALPFLLLPLIFSSILYADSAPRTTITVYKYDGVANAELEKYFDQFKGIIKRRITQISSNLSDPNRGEEFKYISSLDLLESQKKAGSVGQREEVWKNTSVLQLLSGIVFDQGQTATVMSEVYLGVLPDYLKDSLVEIELNVSPEEYRKTNDIYSALTLYSILVDALDKQPSHITSQYLGVARTYVNDLDNQAPLTVELKNALKKVEQALKEKAKPQPQPQPGGNP